MTTDERLPALVLATLRALGVTGHPMLVLAVSGGHDSRVLLHAAAAIWPARCLTVGHVHHGLQAGADDWQAFCARLAAEAGLGFESRRLPARDEPGIEAWARRHRYRALADIAATAGAELVLTAHHGNDQLETAQMRRLRGAGPLGLGGMRVVSPLPGSPGLRLVRPFLGVGRGLLEGYARRHGLDWVDDPSNRDARHLRNRVRASLEAAIARDPLTLDRGLAAIDAIQRDADARRRMARADLDAARLRLYVGPEAAAAGGLLLAQEGGVAGRPRASEDSLSRAALARLPAERAAEALRAWLSSLGCRMPSRAKLAEIRRQLLDAGSAECRLLHDGWWLLRYRDRIAARSRLPEPVLPTWFRWQGEPRLTVAGVTLEFRRLQPARAGLSAQAGLPPLAGLAGEPPGHPGRPAGAPQPRGLAASWLAGRDLLLDRGQRADRLRIDPAGPHRSWRNLVQERGLPRWLRPALPVVRDAEGRGLFAAPFGTVAGFAPGVAAGLAVDRAAGDEDRIEIAWSAPPDLMGWI